jgi:hypothetical protein
VGEQWSERFDVRVSVSEKLTRPVRLRRTFRLASVQGKLATISMKTAVLTPVQDPSISAQLVQRQPSGTIVFDREAGVVVSREIEMDEKVIGAWGANSLVHSVIKRTERLIAEEKLAEQSN